jgi:hypothetical protein
VAGRRDAEAPLAREGWVEPTGEPVQGVRRVMPRSAAARLGSAVGGADGGKVLSRAPVGGGGVLAFVDDVGDGDVDGEPGVHRQIPSN